MAGLKLELTSNVNEIAKKYVDRYVDYPQKFALLIKKLTDIGLDIASICFAKVDPEYVGINDSKVSVEMEDPYTATLKAEGQAVAFIEFGAGIYYGHGHPYADRFGYGAGTYNPESDKWKNPKGWWIPKAKGGGRSFGNYPSMGMYIAYNEMVAEVTRIVDEVFN